ncbi:hypothetical protein [Arthrobacter sp. UYEF3]|uniref:hypothetical protein n=1 Tax=Arthrobacter sp. UYEF3 TaxID=1756365 RepID=UPI0033992D99
MISTEDIETITTGSFVVRSTGGSAIGFVRQVQLDVQKGGPCRSATAREAAKRDKVEHVIENLGRQISSKKTGSHAGPREKNNLSSTLPSR